MYCCCKYSDAQLITVHTVRRCLCYVR